MSGDWRREYILKGPRYAARELDRIKKPFRNKIPEGFEDETTADGLSAQQRLCIQSPLS